MAKKENKKENTPVLNLDGKEYEIESMSDDQKLMVSHISDLNRKIESASFNSAPFLEKSPEINLPAGIAVVVAIGMPLTPITLPLESF